VYLQKPLVHPLLAPQQRLVLMHVWPPLALAWLRVPVWMWPLLCLAMVLKMQLWLRLLRSLRALRQAQRELALQQHAWQGKPASMAKLGMPDQSQVLPMAVVEECRLSQ